MDIVDEFVDLVTLEELLLFVHFFKVAAFDVLIVSGIEIENYFAFLCTLVDVSVAFLLLGGKVSVSCYAAVDPVDRLVELIIPEALASEDRYRSGVERAAGGIRVFRAGR